MIMVPFVIALGYDSIVAITVTYVASQVGNAVSWMSPFSVAVAQGIAGIPVLSGAGFRLAMWVIVTLLSAGYMMIYAERYVRTRPTPLSMRVMPISGEEWTLYRRRRGNSVWAIS